MVLKYTGTSLRRGGLKEGMYVTVPTNWATCISGKVSKDAISEIMEALDDKNITISGDDYEHVFATFTVENWEWASPLINPGRRAGKTLLFWKKV